MLRTISIVLALAASAARADGSVGLVVQGDPLLQAAMSVEVAQWLEQHGHVVDAAALPADGVNALVDCFVLEDMVCAREVVRNRSRTDAVVIARVDVRRSGTDRTVTIAAAWVSKNESPRTQRSECSRCTEDVLRITTDAILFSLKGATAAAPASAPEPRRETVVDTPAAYEPRRQRGLAVGVELGEPSSLTIGWFAGKLALIGAIGTGTRAGLGVHAHAGAQLEVARLRPNVPVRIGLSARFYHHGYEPASIDEIPDDHIGIRATGALALERGAMQLYAEIAPGIDMMRSTSCAFANGTQTVCPHAQATPLFLQFVVGARWFLTH